MVVPDGGLDGTGKGKGSKVLSIDNACVLPPGGAQSSTDEWLLWFTGTLLSSAGVARMKHTQIFSPAQGEIFA